MQHNFARIDSPRVVQPQQDDDWDRQMQADAAAGKFDKLMEEAEAERRIGTLREFPKPYLVGRGS